MPQVSGYAKVSTDDSCCKCNALSICTRSCKLALIFAIVAMTCFPVFQSTSINDGNSRHIGYTGKHLLHLHLLRYSGTRSTLRVFLNTSFLTVQWVVYIYKLKNGIAKYIYNIHVLGCYVLATDMIKCMHAC